MIMLTRFSILLTVQANPKLRKFRYKPLQFKEELDNLFIDNSAMEQRRSNHMDFHGPCSN